MRNIEAGKTSFQRCGLTIAALAAQSERRIG
jgi:hypothetical protein